VHSGLGGQSDEQRTHRDYVSKEHRQVEATENRADTSFSLRAFSAYTERVELVILQFKVLEFRCPVKVCCYHLFKLIRDFDLAYLATSDTDHVVVVVTCQLLCYFKKMRLRSV
jgi:hypothetical protein